MGVADALALIRPTEFNGAGQRFRQFNELDQSNDFGRQYARRHEEHGGS